MKWTKVDSSGVSRQYLTETTRSTSFFINWKALTPSERSMRSDSRKDNRQASLPPQRKAVKEALRSEESDFTSIEFPIRVAVDVFDWTVSLQGLYKQRETFRFNPLLK